MKRLFSVTPAAALALTLALLSLTAAKAAPPDSPGGGNGGGNGGGGDDTSAYTIVPFLPGFTTDSSHVTDLNEGDRRRRFCRTARRGLCGPAL